MARKHARLSVDIWDDEDFVSLGCSEQIVYFSLISSKDLSWCGVVPYVPKRLLHNSRDLTERKVVAALEVLERERFIVTDQDTAEICVRTFIKWDDLMKQPNVAKAMANALDRVHSQRISAAVVAELSRLYKDDSGLRGWRAIRDDFPELFEQVIANPSGNPFGNPSRKAS